MQDRVLERRDLLRERTLEMPKVSPLGIHQSTDQHVHIKKLYIREQSLGSGEEQCLEFIQGQETVAVPANPVEKR